MQGEKSLAVGETVWAMWPGSRKYYEATILNVGKTKVEVNFKENYKTEVALKNIYVSIIFYLACKRDPLGLKRSLMKIGQYFDRFSDKWDCVYLLLREHAMLMALLIPLVKFPSFNLLRG